MRFLQLLVLLLRAADEAHRGHAVAVAVQRPFARLDQFGTIGKTEIIVGAKVQNLRPRRNLDLPRLHRHDHPLGLVKTGGFQPGKLGGEMGQKMRCSLQMQPCLRR